MMTFRVRLIVWNINYQIIECYSNATSMIHAVDMHMYY